MQSITDGLSSAYEYFFSPLCDKNAYKTMTVEKLDTLMKEQRLGPLDNLIDDDICK